jgi:hypothetical protein
MVFAAVETYKKFFQTRIFGGTEPGARVESLPMTATGLPSDTPRRVCKRSRMGGSRATSPRRNDYATSSGRFKVKAMGVAFHEPSRPVAPLRRTAKRNVSTLISDVGISSCTYGQRAASFNLSSTAPTRPIVTTRTYRQVISNTATLWADTRKISVTQFRAELASVSIVTTMLAGSPKRAQQLNGLASKPSVSRARAECVL